MDKIIWIIKGIILNEEKLKACAEMCVEDCKKDAGTEICWWSVDESMGKFCTLCYFENEQCAQRCLKLWQSMDADLKEACRIEKCLLLGEPSKSLLEMTAAMNPHVMPYLTGFERVMPESVEHHDILCITKGLITDPEGFKRAVDNLGTKTKDEDGAAMQWVFVSQDGMKFTIVERFRDAEAAKAHHKTWGECAPEIEKYSKIHKFIILSDIPEHHHTPAPDKVIIEMKYLNGFAR